MPVIPLTPSNPAGPWSPGGPGIIFTEGCPIGPADPEAPGLPVRRREFIVLFYILGDTKMLNTDQ